MDNFRAFRIDEKDGEIVAGFQELGIDDLTEGNVVVRVTHSTINYKDALAFLGYAWRHIRLLCEAVQPFNEYCLRPSLPFRICVGIFRGHLDALHQLRLRHVFILASVRSPKRLLCNAFIIIADKVNSQQESSEKYK